MEENLRKHILSEYTNTVGAEMKNRQPLNTALVEISEVDEFLLILNYSRQSRDRG